MTIVTSHEFDQDARGARSATKDGPVFITDGTRPAHVLLSMEQYLKLTRPGTSIVDALAMPDGDDFEFDPPRHEDDGLKPFDL